MSGVERKPIVLRADWALTAPDQPALRHAAVVVESGRIKAIGPAQTIGRPDGAEVMELGAAILMPGLVNAHQHGRGISQLLLGYSDTALEPWIAGRKQHGPPDIRAVTRLAAESMLANGVTAALHANYTYGTGDYAQEIRAQIKGYQDVGLRVTICLGLQDRGYSIYPNADDAAFAAALPDSARSLALPPAYSPYMPDWPASLALMDQLQAEYAHDPLIHFAWGPAGPQWVSDGMWRAIAKDAEKRNVGLHFHLLESPAQAKAARDLYPGGTLAHLQRLRVFEGPTSCAHGVYLTASDIQIAAAEGLVVVLNPGANLRLFNGAPPVASLRDAGIRLAAGTDNCALNDDEDYLKELRLAATLGRSCQMRTGYDEAADSFRMGTCAGSAALFLDNEGDRLATGRRADMTAFRVSGLGPLDLIDAQRLAELFFARGAGKDCCLTMVAGSVRYADRPEDRLRSQHTSVQAIASVRARVQLATDDQIGQLQTGLRNHYAARKGR